MCFPFEAFWNVGCCPKLHLIVCWQCSIYLKFTSRDSFVFVYFGFVDSHIHSFQNAVLFSHLRMFIFCFIFFFFFFLFCYIFQARVYLLSSGFSLAFGSMFAKTYRVHRIFTRSGISVCKDKMLQDTQLISLVCALLLLDGLVLTLWVVFDPMERHLSNLTLEISLTDRSVVYQPQVNNK